MCDEIITFTGIILANTTNTISTNATSTVVSFIRDHDVTKCLTLLGPKKYNAVFDRIKYLIGLKSCSTYVDSHNHAKIKVDSADCLPLEKNIGCTWHCEKCPNTEIFHAV